MTWRGLVEWIETETPRGFLASDQIAGATSLPCSDGDAFLSADDSGTDTGEVVIDGETYDFTSVTISDDESVTPSTLVISPGLLADQESGTPIDLVSDAESRFAGVSADNGIGDVLSVRIPHNLAAYASLVDGTYEGDARLTVDVDRVNGELVIVNVVDQIPKIAGSTIDGPIPAGSQPDPVAPASSPLPVTVGGLRQVFVKIEPVANPTLVSYEFHVTATSGAAAPTPGDTATLLKDDPGVLMAASTLPDGTPFVYVYDDDTDPLTPDVPRDYYFSVIAHSGDQYAAPSAWVAGRMDKTASSDIVAGAVTTELLSSVLAIVGLLQIGGGLIELSPPTSADDGDGGYILGGGIVVKDPDNLGGEPLVRLHPMGCTFRGQMTADIITVLYDLVINGDVSVAGGSTMTLKNGVPDPLTGPSWSVGPGAGQAWPTAAGYERRGIAWDGSQWYELLHRTSTKRAYARTVSTAGVAGTAFIMGRTLGGGETDGNTGYGLAVIGSNLFYTWTVSASYSYITKTGLTGTLVAQTIPTDTGLVYTLGPSGSSEIVVFNEPLYGAARRQLEAFNTSLTSVAVLDTGDMSWFSPPMSPTSIMTGSFDFGGDRVVITSNDGSTVEAHVFDPDWGADTIVEDAAEGWVTGDFNLAWDSSIFQSLGDAATTLHEWTDYYPSSDGVWSAVYEDLTAGGHTAPSPATTATIPARNLPVLTLPPAPSGVTGSDVWVGYAASGDAATKYLRAETLVGRTLVLTDLKDTSGTTTIPAGSTAGGAPATIESEASPGWVGSGNGEFTVENDLSDPLHAINFDQLIGTVANVAALPGSGDFTGQRIYCTATKEIAVWNGSEWTEIWKDYTPTWTDRTAGTSTNLNVARYCLRGHSLEMNFHMRLGTGGAFTGVPTMDLPYTPVNNTLTGDIGVARMVDASASVRRHAAVQLSAGTAVVTFEVENGTPVGAQTSATAPWTWAVDDYIAGVLRCEVTP